MVSRKIRTDIENKGMIVFYCPLGTFRSTLRLVMGQTIYDHTHFNQKNGYENGKSTEKSINIRN